MNKEIKIEKAQLFIGKDDLLNIRIEIDKQELIKYTDRIKKKEINIDIIPI